MNQLQSRQSIKALEDGILCYMPGGTATITPSQVTASGRKPVTVTVMVNENSAKRLEQQRKALTACGKKPFFSLQHETEIAAFWPSRFFWDKRVDATGSFVEGVWAEGEWTKSGRAAVEGKDFRTFSPSFFVNAIRNDPDNPCEVVCNEDARANMGALENDPAFQEISPLWARGSHRVEANDASGDHTIELVVTGAAAEQLLPLLDHLKKLGSAGSSRSISVQDSDQKFGFDGDGAAKIKSVKHNGKDTGEAKVEAKDERAVVLACHEELRASTNPDLEELQDYVFATRGLKVKRDAIAGYLSGVALEAGAPFGNKNAAGSHDTRDLFHSMVTRKPDRMTPPAEHDYEKMSQAQKDALDSKPHVELSDDKEFADDHDHLNSEGKSASNVEYVAKHKGDHYYVNTEGYNYPRYAMRIRGYKPPTK